MTPHLQQYSLVGEGGCVGLYEATGRSVNGLVREVVDGPHLQKGGER